MTRQLPTVVAIVLCIAAAPPAFVDSAHAKGQGSAHHASGSHVAGGGHRAADKSSGGMHGGGHSGGGHSGGGRSGDNPFDTARAMLGLVGGVLGR